MLLNGLRVDRIRSQSSCKEVTHARSLGSTRLRLDSALGAATAQQSALSAVTRGRPWITSVCITRGRRCRCCWTRGTTRTPTSSVNAQRRRSSSGTNICVSKASLRRVTSPQRTVTATACFVGPMRSSSRNHGFCEGGRESSTLQQEVRVWLEMTEELVSSSRFVKWKNRAQSV